MNIELRDYFAAKAIPIIAKQCIKEWKSDDCFEGLNNDELNIIAFLSYRFADEMIKERNKK